MANESFYFISNFRFYYSLPHWLFDFHGAMAFYVVMLEFGLPRLVVPLPSGLIFSLHII